ncbi:polyprotein [Golden shiner totivirus]|uniref:polyprotein n=1 Tax=Golden shiner totivirus TaxID=1856030 RepID=UPI0007DE2608|nr:polyprotein [Golden shiner totivirus]ANH79338.1 polyprotein [Golden shiner totivirus]
MATTKQINDLCDNRNDEVDWPQNASGQTSTATVTTSLVSDASFVVIPERSETTRHPISPLCKKDFRPNSPIIEFAEIELSEKSHKSIETMQDFKDEMLKINWPSAIQAKLATKQPNPSEESFSYDDIKVAGRPIGKNKKEPKNELALLMYSEKKRNRSNDETTNEIDKFLRLLSAQIKITVGEEPVQRVNEACLRVLHRPPVFTILRIGGPDHLPQFLSICFIVINRVCLRVHTISTSKKDGNRLASNIWIDYLSGKSEFPTWYNDIVFASLPIDNKVLEGMKPSLKVLNLNSGENAWIRDLTREGVEKNPGPYWVDSICAKINGTGRLQVPLPGIWKAKELTKVTIFMYGAVPQHPIESYGSGSLLVTLDDAKAKKSKFCIPLTNAVTTSIKIEMLYTPKVDNPNFQLDADLGNLAEIRYAMVVSHGYQPQVEISDQPIWVTDIPTDHMIKVNTQRMKRDLTKDGDIESNPGPTPCIMCSSWDCNHTVEDISAMFNGNSKILTSVVEAEYTSESIEAEHSYAIQDVEITPDEHTNLMTKLRIEPAKHSTEFSKSYFEHHLNNMCKGANNTSIWAEHMATFYPQIPIKTQNRFQVLTEDKYETDATNDHFEETQFKIDANKLTRKQVNQRKEHPTLQDEEVRKQKKKKVEDIATTQDNINKARQAQLSAVKRIAAKWKEQPWLLIRAIETKIKKPFLSLVMKEAFGDNWEEQNEFDNITMAAYCYLRDIPKRIERAMISLIDNRISDWTYKQNAEWAEFYQSQFGDNWYSDLKVLASEKLLHNKKVHAYNGNPTFTHTMDDVDSCKNWPKFYETNNGGQKLLGSTLQTLFSYLPSTATAISNDLGKQDSITANIINENNTTDGPASQRFPNTSLIPRRVRKNADKTLIDCDKRLQVHLIDVCDYMSSSLRQTDLGEMLTNVVRNQNSSAWRKDNITLSGFSAFDMVGINVVQSIKGLSLEQVLLKLELLHSVLAHNVINSWIPTSEYDAIDGLTKPTNRNGVLGINDSLIFGETCGGNTALFPFTGEAGTIAFHLTLGSIPENRRPNAIFMPPAILQAFESGPEAIALFVMLWAEWPFGLYTITKQTTDNENKNEAEQKYIANECTTKVPGYMNIDIVLPRQTSAPNPTAQGQANNLAVVRPHVGSQPSTAFPVANAVLDISFVGPAGLTEYNLCEYLFTWALNFDQTTIRAMLARLNAIVKVSDTLNAMHEVALSCHSAFGVLMEQNRDNTTIQNANSVSQMRTSDAFCFWHGMTGSDWPCPTGIGSYDRLILRTDILTWNQVVLGLRTNEEVSPTHEDLPEHIGNPRCVYWEALTAQLMASVMTVNFANIGISTLSWEGSFTNTTMMSYQRIARDLFCRIGQGGQLAVGRFGNMLRYLTANMTGFSPSVQEIMGFEVTAYHRILPQVHFAAPIRNEDTRLTLMPPAIMVDVQIQMLSENLPKWTNSFPPPKGLKSTMGYSDGLYLLRTTNLANSSTFIQRDIMNPALNSNELPDVEDETLWNQRLMWWGSNTRIIADYTGTVIAGGLYPGPTQFLKQRPRINYPGLVTPTGTLNANTISFPRVNSLGLRVFPFEPVNVATLYVQAMKRVNQLNKQAWLINGVIVRPTLLAIDEKRDKWLELTDKANFQMEESGKVNSEIVPPEALPNLQDQTIEQIA